MSEFSVHRTADTIPALKYCLILDGKRIAGGKPDYRGNNHLISWSTRETYGSIDQLKAENAKLRELVKDIHTLATDYGVCVQYPYCEAWDERLAVAEKHMHELGIEVD